MQFNFATERISTIFTIQIPIKISEDLKVYWPKKIWNHTHGPKLMPVHFKKITNFIPI